MSDRPRALIVGGSVGGLFAARFLRRMGWDTMVFERATGDLASRGAAIGVTAQLFDIMQRIDIPLDGCDTGRVRSFVAVDPDGAVTHQEARELLTAHWANIYRPLRKAVPPEAYRAGVALKHVEQTADRVRVLLSDGTHVEGDLLIGADGINSAVRNQLLPGAQPRYAGYVAWRGVVEAKDIASDDHELIFNHLVFAITDTELALCIPLPAAPAADARSGPRRAGYIWYRPADEALLRELCTDASGRAHGVTIPPPLIRTELVAELKAISATSFAPAITGVIAHAGRPLLQAISDLETPQMVFGRVALLGDAAFVARPHAVAGVTKAALDAQALAEAVAAGGDLSVALARYDRERRNFGQRLVAHARSLGAYIEAGHTGARRAPDPAVMLRNYGAPHLLRRA